MKKILKNIPKSMIVSIFTLVLLTNIIIPFKAIASGSLTFTFTTDANSGYTLTSPDSKHLVVNSDYVDVVTSTEGEINSDNISTSCTDNVCTLTVTNQEDGVRFRFNGQAFSMRFGSNNNVYDSNTVFTNNENITITASDMGNEAFVGEAYLIWSCGNGVCYHLFNDIPTDNSSYYIKDSTITADNKAGTTFSVSANSKAFAFKNTFLQWQEDYKNYNHLTTIDWTTVDINDVIGSPFNMGEYEAASGCKPEDYDNEDDFHTCVDQYVAGLGLFTSRAQVRPTSEPTLRNAYVSYGDRNFKVTVYNDNFRALSIGDLSDFTYYPNTWADGLVKQDAYDISGTSSSNPSVIEVVLLEDTITLRPLDLNGLSVTSIEALDVPSNAVTVTKNNNGTFTIVFRSNFYDNVIFKVTDSNNNNYYVKIYRNSINALSIDPHRGRGIFVSAFYYDRTTSYNDYVLTATINYKDGTTEIVELENARYIDDGLGNTSTQLEEDLENPTRPDWTHGKGLKVASYKYNLTSEQVSTIDSVYVNAEYNGSTSSNYAGAFSGSGKGVLLEIAGVN